MHSRKIRGPHPEHISELLKKCSEFLSYMLPIGGALVNEKIAILSCFVQPSK